MFNGMQNNYNANELFTMDNDIFLFMLNYIFSIVLQRWRLHERVIVNHSITAAACVGQGLLSNMMTDGVGLSTHPLGILGPCRNGE